MQVTFFGAAGEVTGSCFLVETARQKFLVDCGMFQGGREAKGRNAHPFPFTPREIDFVLLTHAHIDHSGLLPKLTKDGFRGWIYATAATSDLLGIMLPDSAHIQEFEAERAARNGARKKGGEPHPITPIYTVQDAQRCLEQLAPVAYEELVKPADGVRVRFSDAGHILGSAILEIWVGDGGVERKLVFSGDLGQPGRPILRDPVAIGEADFLFVESTYGNRCHKDMAATLDEFVDAVQETLERKGGNVIIPAFAVGRTQEIIYHFHDLTRQGRLRNLNIFVDSPMATEATRITVQHMGLFDQHAKALAEWRARGVGLPQLKFTASVDDSRALNAIRGGAVIISASGMCDAGRIKHHLRHNLGRRENTILITGFQAQGTLGRRLVDGAKTVRIFNETITVRADIYTLGGFSAHADQPALMRWLQGFRRPPAHTFVLHGEPLGAEGLVERVRAELGWAVSIPQRGDRFQLAEQGATQLVDRRRPQKRRLEKVE